MNEPARRIDTGVHPLADGRPPSWASGWGQDQYGVFTEITYKEVTQRLRWCPPGRFLMGSPEDEPGRHKNEGPQVEITFEQGFWLFDTTVTQELYKAVMRDNPSTFFEASDDHPVETLSLYETQLFLEHLNAVIPGIGLSLPSEAQWEYACRAGSDTPFEPTVAAQYKGCYITSDEVNYNGDYPIGKAPTGEYRKKTVPVTGGSFRPNTWGLWHMHGNVWERCADKWHDSHAGADQYGAPRLNSQRGGGFYVVRGGSWHSLVGHCRSACRNRLRFHHSEDDLGFRPATRPANWPPLETDP